MPRAPRRAVPKRRPRRRRAIPDSQQLAGIKQGVGRAVVRAFGGVVARRGRKRGGKRGMAAHPCCLDAFHMSHLPLPRPTGPYTVIRTTQVIGSSDPLMVLGPTWDHTISRWSNLVAYGVLDVTKKWSAANNVQQFVFESMKTGSWGAAQVCPSAFSVQVMNPNPIQDSRGIVYGGRIRTEWKPSNNKDAFPSESANHFISYNMPRLMASTKLAFRGVQTDAVPFNMSRLADFTPMSITDQKDTAIGSGTWDFAGFNPQFYYNPDKVPLIYLVCCEWRVRFDPTNPAQASHIQYSNADESIWMRLLHSAEAAGNGVIDIADKVAQTGNAIFNASAGAYRAGRGMRALTAGVGQLALA